MAGTTSKRNDGLSMAFDDGGYTLNDDIVLKDGKKLKMAVPAYVEE